MNQNLRGLKTHDDTRFEELFRAMKARRANVATVQETWRSGSEETEHKATDGSLGLFLGHAPPNQVGRGTKGVGILLETNAVSAWRTAGNFRHGDGDNGRILAVRMEVKDSRDKDYGLFVVSTYAPVGDASQQEWDRFFDDVHVCINKKKHDDVLWIGMDCNSSMGTEDDSTRQMGDYSVVGKFGVHYRNAAGERMLTFLAQHRMIALSTFFDKPEYSTMVRGTTQQTVTVTKLTTRANTA